MKKGLNIHISVLCLCIWLLVSSCQQPGGNTTGSEFMPDMAHSIAYEANHYTYYYNNTWGSEDDYYKYAKPRESVEGTVARGAAGMATSHSDLEKSLMGELTNSSIKVPFNGSVPYNYSDTEEDRTRAAQEMVNNPFPISDAELAKSKELYNTFCGICHGEKGDGLGYLVREDGGKYPAQPANLLLEQYYTMTNGQYYHAIMYGKNLMGGYADKLSYEERWNVIHYIRSLQAKELKLKYNETENTLNDWATPLADIAVVEPAHDMEGHHDGDSHDHHESESHGDDHDNNDHGHDGDHGDHDSNEDHGDHH